MLHSSLDADCSAADGHAAMSPFSILSDVDFSQQILAVRHDLLLFARSRARSLDEAEDLVQDTFIRAWAARHRFAAGTNMRAWTFSILRNRHNTLWHRSKRWVAMDDETQARLVSPATQEEGIELSDVHEAMKSLPHSQRQTLVLVGVAGASLALAAEKSDCAIGTIKSRLSRARLALAAKLQKSCPPRRERSKRPAMELFLAEARQLDIAM